MDIFQLLASNIKHGTFGLVVCNVNPCMTLLQLLSVSDQIKKRFNLAHVKAEGYEPIFKDTLLEILNNVKEP